MWESFTVRERGINNKNMDHSIFTIPAFVNISCAEKTTNTKKISKARKLFIVDEQQYVFNMKEGQLQVLDIFTVIRYVSLISF